MCVHALIALGACVCLCVCVCSGGEEKAAEEGGDFPFVLHDQDTGITDSIVTCINWVMKLFPDDWGSFEAILAADRELFVEKGDVAYEYRDIPSYDEIGAVLYHVGSWVEYVVRLDKFTTEELKVKWEQLLQEHTPTERELNTVPFATLVRNHPARHGMYVCVLALDILCCS